MIGPEQVSKSVAPLREAGNGLLVEKGGPVGNLEQLGRNLKRLRKASPDCGPGSPKRPRARGCWSRARTRPRRGRCGSASGLATATAGSEEAVGALDQFAEGAKKLQKGADAITKALRGSAGRAEFIDKTMGDLSTNIRNNGLRRSRKLQKKLTKTAHDELDALKQPATATNTSCRPRSSSCRR